MLLEQGLTHFRKRELEGHLGFAVAQEVNAGRNEFVLVSWTVLDTASRRVLVFTYSWNSSDVREARLGTWKGKRKQIFHLDGRRARDGLDGRKQKARYALGTPFVPTHAIHCHSLAPGVFILHLPFPEAVLGRWDPAKNKADRHTVSVDVLMERQWAGTHSFTEVSVRVRWQRMANGRSSRKAFRLPFDSGTDTHVSQSVSTMRTFCLEGDVCCYHLCSGNQLRSGTRHNG